MKTEQTERGFAYVEFTDENGELCNIQKSSLATDDCIWLGAAKLNVKTQVYGEGWKEMELPCVRIIPKIEL